jgi:hypothetical protein
MNALTKINPKTKMLTANGVGVVAGPALLYMGVFYAPSVKQKVAFAGLGALLTFASYHGMKAGFGQE